MNKEILQLHESDKIVGEIYKITNLINNKMYVGQTRSHYLNKNKYRPFGYNKRFKSHISESSSISKYKSCKYLNNAFNKYGTENFICELITTCELSELDNYEVKYISELNTRYPHGYNLTNGGQKCGFEKGKKVSIEAIKPEKNIEKKYSRTNETKELISKRIKEYKSDINVRKAEMKRTQRIHSINRFDKFKNEFIDESNIDRYILVINNNTLNYKYIRVTINKKRTTFVGQYEDIEDIKQRARNFILEILEWQRIQIAGTSLEPSLPLTIGNVSEELG